MALAGSYCLDKEALFRVVRSNNHSALGYPGQVSLLRVHTDKGPLFHVVVQACVSHVVKLAHVSHVAMQSSYKQACLM